MERNLDLHDAVLEIVEMLEASGRSRGILLHVRDKEEAPVAKMQRYHLEQVLLLLIATAQNVASAGNGSVSVGATRSNGSCIVTVSIEGGDAKISKHFGEQSRRSTSLQQIRRVLGLYHSTLEAKPAEVTDDRRRCPEWSFALPYVEAPAPPLDRTSRTSLGLLPKAGNGRT